MVDQLPEIQGTSGPIEATPVILLDTTGAAYKAAVAGEAAALTPPARKIAVVVDVALSLDTGIYAANEVLADTQVITNAFRAIDVGGELESVTVIDKDHLTAANDAMTIWFLDANVSIGTENNAPNISDADALKVHCKVPVVAGDYTDFTGSMIANVGNLRRVLKPIAGTRDLAIAVTNAAGTPTHTAAGVVLRLGILQD